MSALHKVASAAGAVAVVASVAVGAANYTAPRARLNSDVEITVQEQGGGSSLGSGVYIGNGIVITAGHMVLEGTPDLNSYQVIVDANGKPGDKVHATVLWADKDHDLAALKLDKVPVGLGTATLGPALPEIGAKIEVVGNPLGETFIHTWGHVAGVPRDASAGNDPSQGIAWHWVLPLDVEFTNGNSGGPVYLAGTDEVVGIVVGEHLNIQGQNIFPGTVHFVVPSTVVLQDLKNPPKWTPPAPEPAQLAGLPSGNIGP